jgi:hypothetical protein
MLNNPKCPPDKEEKDLGEISFLKDERKTEGIAIGEGSGLFALSIGEVHQ